MSVYVYIQYYIYSIGNERNIKLDFLCEMTRISSRCPRGFRANELSLDVANYREFVVKAPRIVPSSPRDRNLVLRGAIVSRSWIASHKSSRGEEPRIALRLKPRRGITGACIGLALSFCLIVYPPTIT